MSLRSVEVPKVSLQGMTDRQLEEHIERLAEIFPYQPIFEIRNAIAMCNGCLDEAFDLLSGSPGPSSASSAGSTLHLSRASLSQNAKSITVKNEGYDTLEDITNTGVREKVATLLELGISQPLAFLVDVLSGCSWNVNEAAVVLLNESMSPSETVEPRSHIHVKPLSHVTGDNLSVHSTTNVLDPTPPPTPPTIRVQEQQYPDGIIPSFQISLKNGNPAAKTMSQQEAQCLLPTAKKASKRDQELMVNSVEVVNNNIETNEGEDNIQSRVARLHELLPGSSKTRCESFLQIYDDVDEAFTALEEELAENGTGSRSSSETDSDDSEANNESETIERSNNGRATKISLTSRRLEKRRAETQEEPPTKKSRVSTEEEEEEEEEEAEAAKLAPASQWVCDTFGDRGGVSIVLASGKHPCQFPKDILCKNFKLFREQMELSPLASEKGTIKLSDVQPEIFDLAIQFAICKTIQLNRSQARTKSAEITSMLDLVLLAIKIGLPGAGYGIAARLKDILIDQRNALQGSHIETAYTLKKGHPIRKVIVKSLARAYFVFQEPPTSRKAQVYRKGEGDNARRNAFSGERFIVQDQLDSLDEFKRELSDATMDILHNRNDCSSRSGKTHKISYTDPLSGENFSL